MRRWNMQHRLIQIVVFIVPQFAKKADSFLPYLKSPTQGNYMIYCFTRKNDKGAPKRVVFE